MAALCGFYVLSCEKKFICFVYPLGYILYSLGADFFQIGKPGNFLQFAQMLLQSIYVQRFPEQSIVSLMQSNAMIVDKACRINLTMEFPVSF